MDDTERFEYLVIANCDHCDQEVKYVGEFEDPVALDRSVSIKWASCPYCGEAPAWWDVTEEFEIERVTPTQERAKQPEKLCCMGCGSSVRVSDAYKAADGSPRCSGCADGRGLDSWTTATDRSGGDGR